MAHLPLIYAPNDIFRKQAKHVVDFDEALRATVDSMFETIYLAHGLGIAGNMVGILKRIALVDLQENDVRTPLIFINPEITWRSDEKQIFEEGSLSFPGITAEIARPKAIKLKYQDLSGNYHAMDADGFLATAIQHEIDYLDGKTFLDYVSKMKKDILIRKMQKYIKMYPPHIHTENCNH